MIAGIVFIKRGNICTKINLQDNKILLGACKFKTLSNICDWIFSKKLLKAKGDSLFLQNIPS